MGMHHLHDRAIDSMAKMVITAGTTKPSGASFDRTPEWVRQTIRRVEKDLAPKIKKYKKKEREFNKYLLHNRDEKRWEVWQKGNFGRDTLLAAAEYRKEVEYYL